MNPTSKKFISLFLIFSLVMVSVNLYAKERRGAKLVVTKLDGQQIKGELITVKPNSLLLLNTEGKDVSVNIRDIRAIRIKKKMKILSGAFYGLFVGAIIGSIASESGTQIQAGSYRYWSDEDWMLFYMASWGFLGLLAGGIFGVIMGNDKVIQIEGMTDSEIQKTLDKLRKKARIRDYK